MNLTPSFEDYEPHWEEEDYSVAGRRGGNATVSTSVGLTASKSVQYCMGRDSIPQTFGGEHIEPKQQQQKTEKKNTHPLTSANSNNSNKSLHPRSASSTYTTKRAAIISKPALHTNPFPQNEPFTVPHNEDYNKSGAMVMRTAFRHLIATGSLPFIRGTEMKCNISGETFLELKVDVKELMVERAGGVAKGRMEHPVQHQRGGGRNNTLATNTSTRNDGCWLVDEVVSIRVVMSRCADLCDSEPASTGRHIFGSLPLQHDNFSNHQDEGIVVAIAHVPDYRTMIATGRASWGGKGLGDASTSHLQDGRHPWEPSFLETCAFKVFTVGGESRRRRRLLASLGGGGEEAGVVSPPTSPLGVVGRREVRGKCTNLNNTAILRARKFENQLAETEFEPFEEYDAFEVPLIRQQDAAALASLKARKRSIGSASRLLHQSTRHGTHHNHSNSNVASSAASKTKKDDDPSISCASWAVRGVTKHPLAPSQIWQRNVPTTPTTHSMATHLNKKSARITVVNTCSPLPDFSCESYTPTLLPAHYNNSATDDAALVGDTKGVALWDWSHFSAQITHAITHLIMSRKGGASLV